MKSEELMLALESWIVQTMAGLELPCPRSGHQGPPQVYLHALPDRGLGDQTAWPFIVARLASGKTDEERADETVMLGIGVYAPEDQRLAGLLTARCLDTIRAGLLRDRIIGKKFEVVLPVSFAAPEPGREWHDYHFVTVETHWKYMLPRRSL